jgi:hypothetical protein
MSSLSDFVEVPGNLVPRIPYEAASALMQSGFVKGDVTKLQASVDTILNGPAAGRLKFAVVTDLVLITMLYCPKMTSADPVDHLMGSESEGDIGFWTLVWGGPADDISHWSLRWLPIYLFVDSGTAMAAGREVFGFPKSLGTFNRATHNSDDGRVSVDTLLFKTYGVDSQAVTTQLFEIAYGTGTATGGLFSGLEHALADIGSLMVKGLDAVTHNGLDLSKLKLPMVGMPMVFLKQFRDAAVANKACYQEIVEATVESTKIHEFGMLSGSYQLNFIDCASYPINADMGIISGQELIFPMWLIQDFTCGFGTIL